MPLRLSFRSGPLAGVHIVTSAPAIRLGRESRRQRHPADEPQGLAPARADRALGARRLPRSRCWAPARRSSTATRSRPSAAAPPCTRCRPATGSISAASRSSSPKAVAKLIAVSSAVRRPRDRARRRGADRRGPRLRAVPRRARRRRGAPRDLVHAARLPRRRRARPPCSAAPPATPACSPTATSSCSAARSSGSRSPPRSPSPSVARDHARRARRGARRRRARVHRPAR